MKRDPLDLFRAVLEDSFRQVLPDPSMVGWLADLVIEKIRLELAGQRIPSRVRSETRRRDARVLEMLRQGVSVPAICERLGIAPSTVYRAEARERQRRKISAAA